MKNCKKVYLGSLDQCVGNQEPRKHEEQQNADVLGQREPRLAESRHEERDTVTNTDHLSRDGAERIQSQ
jgi:hypothetical protein